MLILLSCRLRRRARDHRLVKENSVCRIIRIYNAVTETMLGADTRVLPAVLLYAAVKIWLIRCLFIGVGLGPHAAGSVAIFIETSLTAALEREERH